MSVESFHEIVPQQTYKVNKYMTFHLMLLFSHLAVFLSVIILSACFFRKTCRDVWVLSNYYYYINNVDRNLLLLMKREREKKELDVLPCSATDFVSIEMENLISYDRHFHCVFIAENEA